MAYSERSTSTRPGIDLQSPEVRADPYPTYALMRNHYPVCQTEPDGLWAVSRFEDVRFVLANPEIFSASGADALYKLDADEGRDEIPRLIISQDPPEHGKYHRLVNKAFLDKATRQLIPLMRDTARSLLARFGEETPADFVEQFAYPYVGTIIRRIVGLDDRQSLTELRQWMKLEESVAFPRPDDAFVEDFKAAISLQNRYFKEIMSERRKRPRNDLVTQLVEAEVDGRKLSDEEICGLLCMLVSAGYVTTTHMLSHAVVVLSREPELLAELRASPRSIPAFVEELLRFSPAVLATIRTTNRAMTLADVKIPAGATVLPLLAAANRDPSVYRDPDVFDMARPRIGRHLTFGYGIHTCLGAALARLELRIALETLLGNCTRIVCPPDEDLIWTHTQFVRGVSELPVRFY